MKPMNQFTTNLTEIKPEDAASINGGRKRKLEKIVRQKGNQTIIKIGISKRNNSFKTLATAVDDHRIGKDNSIEHIDYSTRKRKQINAFLEDCGYCLPEPRK